MLELAIVMLSDYFIYNDQFYIDKAIDNLFWFQLENDSIIINDEINEIINELQSTDKNIDDIIDELNIINNSIN